MREPAFAYAKTKTQISFAVSAKLISTFVFATWIVQSLFYLNTKFQASIHLQWLYSPVCVGPGQKPRKPVFSQQGSYESTCIFGDVLINFFVIETGLQATTNLTSYQCMAVLKALPFSI